MAKKEKKSFLQKLFGKKDKVIKETSQDITGKPIESVEVITDEQVSVEEPIEYTPTENVVEEVEPVMPQPEISDVQIEPVNIKITTGYESVRSYEQLVEDIIDTSTSMLFHDEVPKVEYQPYKVPTCSTEGDSVEDSVEDSQDENSTVEELSAEEIVGEFYEEPVEEYAGDIVEEFTDETPEEPTDDLVEGESTVAVNVDVEVEEPIEESVDESIEESVDESVEEVVEEPTEDIVKEPTEEPTEEVTEEAIEEPIDEPAGPEVITYERLKELLNSRNGLIVDNDKIYNIYGELFLDNIVLEDAIIKDKAFIEGLNVYFGSVNDIKQMIGITQMFGIINPHIIPQTVPGQAGSSKFVYTLVNENPAAGSVLEPFTKMLVECCSIINHVKSVSSSVDGTQVAVIVEFDMSAVSASLGSFLSSIDKVYNIIRTK